MTGWPGARWWLSDIPGAIEACERAYTAYRRAGQDEPAAHVAVLLSREHAEGLGNDAMANGWLARARDLLAGQPDSIEWGWVALVESERVVDPTPALQHAEQALAVARSARDPDLELAALGRAGLAEIALGQIEEGMTRFDDGMAASAAGEAADLRTLSLRHWTNPSAGIAEISRVLIPGGMLVLADVFPNQRPRNSARPRLRHFHAAMPTDLADLLAAHRLAVIGCDRTPWFRLPDVHIIASATPRR